MDLDMRRVRYFVAVAEECSFVRAASRLYMTQPALSRQVRALEEDLGVVLFVRNRQGTVLTRAGRQLLEDAQPMLAMSLAVQQRVRAAGREESHFTVGFMPGVIVTPIVREFSRVAPGVRVEVLHTSITDQVDYLLDGRVDVCFVRLPLPEGMFEVVPLFPEPLVAALPSSHPLAQHKAVCLDDLRNLALLQDHGDVPEWRGPVFRGSAAAQGDSGRFPVTIEERLEAVASGAGCYVMPAGIADFYRRDDVSCLTLEDMAPRMVALAYPKHRTMPELHRFAEISRRMLGPGTN
ncbi:LysR family transcriptional regulator [Streptomyces sp. KK5PA1]|uniref:LysR family transcriptional regulator n=1 Tax=Actinacidiphila acididurans TaxID=2784346 RepID=A0ABS2TI79_9ACTN|nr:LysR family transcriptional regulator [Actinacidiphila acididurans]